MINSLKILQLTRIFLIIIVTFFVGAIHQRISNIEKNQIQKIKILTEQNKIYKKLSHPKYLTEKEIFENQRIIDITDENLNNIKEDKIGENGYLLIMIAAIFVLWKLNKLLLNKIENIKNVA